MRLNMRTRGSSSEKTVKDIRRATRKQYSAEEKIRIVLDGLRGEETIAECSLINFKAANQAARINQSLKETVFER